MCAEPSNTTASDAITANLLSQRSLGFFMVLAGNEIAEIFSQRRKARKVRKLILTFASLMPLQETLLSNITLFAKIFLRAGMERDVQLSRFATAAKFADGHRALVEMIDRDMFVAKVDGSGHVVGDLVG